MLREDQLPAHVKEFLSGTGRIAELIRFLKDEHRIEAMEEIDPQQKLDALCWALQLSYRQFDQLIASHSPVLRAMKGHAFEIVFEYLLRRSGYKVVVAGGDTQIDLIVNDRTLQLKTPWERGTAGDIVQYKTHKTHGPKSEQESLEYYHSVQGFADYLVGLVAYDPLQVLFLHRDELPRHPLDPGRIASPFAVEWPGHRGLNAFDRIGIAEIDLSASLYLASDPQSELLPRSAKALNLATDIILTTILREPNFRIWDMAIRGFARELYFRDYLREHGVKQFNPTECRAERGEKADFALRGREDRDYHFFQVKGVSTNNCAFNGRNSVVGVETQLTRGRVSDHPTQSRLYLCSDFDFLIIGLDPVIANRFSAETGTPTELEWEFYAVPTPSLETHPRFPRRLKSLQRLGYLPLQEYHIDQRWLHKWKKADS